MTPQKQVSPKQCVKCGRRGKVNDSRQVPSLNAHRRHHVCRCGHDWTTYELGISIDQVRELVQDGYTRDGRVVVSISTATRQTITKP